MSKRTIAKFCTFVIFSGYVPLIFSACSRLSSNAGEQSDSSRYFPARVVGAIKSKDITESSGVAVSRCRSNVLWTHNDSGDDAYIFAINTAGDSLGTWRVPNAQNNDWEDIAAFKDSSGKCFIYIGDIGANKGKRSEHAVYRVKEPVISPEGANSSRKQPLATENAEIVRFKYPDYTQDAETLMVHPKTADIYVVTKRITGPAGVYCIRRPVFDGSIRPIEKVTISRSRRYRAGLSRAATSRPTAGTWQFAITRRDTNGRCPKAIRILTISGSRNPSPSTSASASTAKRSVTASTGHHYSQRASIAGRRS
jgi:hypothetical protein